MKYPDIFTMMPNVQDGQRVVLVDLFPKTLAGIGTDWDLFCLMPLEYDDENLEEVSGIFAVSLAIKGTEKEVFKKLKVKNGRLRKNFKIYASGNVGPWETGITDKSDKFRRVYCKPSDLKLI